jgi:hypothetical protein
MFSATAMAITGSSHSQPVAMHGQQARPPRRPRCPDVGEQVAGVGFQRHRAVLRALRSMAQASAPFRPS